MRVPRAVWQVDPTDGYAYRLVRADTEEPVFLVQRRSVGLPGLHGIVSPPGTWEPRQRVILRPMTARLLQQSGFGP